MVHGLDHQGAVSHRELYWRRRDGTDVWLGVNLCLRDDGVFEGILVDVSDGKPWPSSILLAIDQLHVGPAQPKDQHSDQPRQQLAHEHGVDPHDLVVRAARDDEQRRVLGAMAVAERVWPSRNAISPRRFPGPIVARTRSRCAASSLRISTSPDTTRAIQLPGVASWKIIVPAATRNSSV